MFKGILKFFFFELIILLIILGLTYSDLLFHFEGAQKITSDEANHISKLNQSNNYEINQPMSFLINIESENGGEKVALLWPMEPFSQFLVLSDKTPTQLFRQQKFQGKLVPCIHKCSTKNMMLDMDAYVERIEKQFPQYKGKFNQLPSFILNTTEFPGGFSGYIQQTKDFWIIFALCVLIGGIILIMSFVLGKQ